MTHGELGGFIIAFSTKEQSPNYNYNYNYYIKLIPSEERLLSWKWTKTNQINIRYKLTLFMGGPLISRVKQVNYVQSMKGNDICTFILIDHLCIPNLNLFCHGCEPYIYFFITLISFHECLSLVDSNLQRLYIQFILNSK